MAAFQPGDRRFIPGFGFGTVTAPSPPLRTFTPAAVLNQQTPIREIQRNLAADNRPIPIVYGHAQVGGSIFALDYSNDTFTIGYLIAQGEIDSYLNVWMDDEAVPEGVTVDYYTGAAGQGVDPKLAAAITDYADTLDGLAYIVVQFGAGVFDTWPQVVAEIQGRKVSDPRASVAYSANPALHLGDLISSTEYGLGFAVDDTALTAAANACDDTTGIGEARRESFVVLDSPRATFDWIDTLATYAGCFVIYRGQTAYLVPDRPAASVATFTASDIVDGSMRIRKKDTSDLPTVVQVFYTDTSGNEWRERQADEASTGAATRRVSRVRLPGVTRHSQAHREAVERLNKLTLSDLEVEFTVFDAGLAREAGDIITVSHPLGLTSKELRLVKAPEMVEPGRWKLVGQEYDAAAYSDSVITQPSTPDTNLPVNAPPDAPASVTINESTYQLQNGKYASRLDLSWTASNSPYVTGYEVKVLQGGNVVWATVINSTAVSTSPLVEGLLNTVQVRAQTALYTGDPATETYTIVGKLAIPDAPATLNGFEAGGEVRLNWPASTDIDAERYKLRYGPTTGDWETATDLDIVDGLRLTTKDVPEGTWRFYVKTIDSIQKESTGAATIDLAVTLDNDAFTAAILAPLGAQAPYATLNMHASYETRGDSYATWYSDGGDSWASLFGGAAMNTFGNALGSYQTLPSETRWVAAEQDLGATQSGNLSITAPTFLYGTPEIQLYDDVLADFVTATSRQFTGHYVRGRFRDLTPAPFAFYEGEGQLRADVVAREETGTDTSAASGATTVTLAREYAARRSISITPEASSARSAVFDNVQLDNGGVTTFDVYIFNSAGAQVATPFAWTWKGV